MWRTEGLISNVGNINLGTHLQARDYINKTSGLQKAEKDIGQDVIPTSYIKSSIYKHYPGFEPVDHSTNARQVLYFRVKLYSHSGESRIPKH